MRKAMMCVTVMLAIIQLWPVVFGAAGSSALAASARPGATVMLVPPSRPLAADGAGCALRHGGAGCERAARPDRH